MPEDLIDAPLVDDAAPIEPEPFTLPEDFATQVQQWDIPVDKLSEAAQMYKAAQTEDGVIEMFIQAGQSLGFGLKDLNRLFSEDDAPPPPAPVAPVAPQEQLDPDRLMSAAEVQELLDAQRAEIDNRFTAQQQAEQERAAKATYDHIESWFDQAGVEDKQTRLMIASYGEKHILPGMNGNDPRILNAALEQGKAEYEAWVEAEAKRYIQKKAVVADAQPTSIGGTPAGTTGNDEAPFDYSAQKGNAYAAARARVRERMRAAGELG